MSSTRRVSLRLSIWEGCFYAVMVGASESLALFLAVKRGATAPELAVLTTLPVLLGAFSQWVVPFFVRLENLKRTMLIFIGIQMVGLLGLVFAAVAPNPFPYFLGSLSLYWVGGLTCGPLWLDWISNWLPRNRMSRFLSRRNSLLAFVTLASYLVSTTFIYFSKSYKGFACVFALALVARLLSWSTMFRQKSPPLPTRDTPFRPVVPESGHGRVVVLCILFTVLFKFTVNLSSPFFLPYTVKDLHFDLWQYTLLTAVPFVGRFAFLSQWGEASKSFRPMVGLQIAMVLIAVNPSLWTYNQNLGYLMTLELFSGALWGGFDLCVVLIIQSYWHGSARKILGLHLSLMSVASLYGARIGAAWHEGGLSFEEIFVRSSNLRAIVAFTCVIALVGLKETRIPLKSYGNFLSTALSLRLSFDNIGRMLPLRRKKA